MKTIGQTYPLSEFEPGDVGAFVRADGDGEPFVVMGRAAVHSTMSKIWYVTDPTSCWRDWDGKTVRYLGRGRIEPARIVMEDV